jgi:hypothetical protein
MACMILVSAGFVPLLLAGRWGSHIPHKSRMTVVLGKPIAVPHLDSPPEELVRMGKLLACLPQVGVLLMNECTMNKCVLLMNACMCCLVGCGDPNL